MYQQYVLHILSYHKSFYSIYTVRKVLAHFAVCDRWRYCKALCDEKFSQKEGNGRKFSHIELRNIVIILTF